MLHIEMTKTPTKEEIDQIVEYARRTTGAFLVHARNDVPVEVPSLDLVMHVLRHLWSSERIVRKRVRGVLVHAFELTPPMLAMKDLAVQLYQPVKPYCITSDDAEAAKFLQVHSVAS